MKAGGWLANSGVSKPGRDLVRGLWPVVAEGSGRPRIASPRAGIPPEPQGISGGHPRAPPAASSGWISTSGCVGLGRMRKGRQVKDQPRAPRQAGPCVDGPRWPLGRSVGAAAGPSLSPRRVGAAGSGLPAPERGRWCPRPEKHAAKLETWGDGAELAQREVVFVLNGFLSHLQFPPLPFAARVTVFKRLLKASGIHFRFLEVC